MAQYADQASCLSQISALLNTLSRNIAKVEQERFQSRRNS